MALFGRLIARLTGAAPATPDRLVDGARLVAQIANPAVNPEIKKAYGRLFSSGDGQLVLADILRRCGFAQPRPADMTNDVRRHLDGQIFLALAIAGDAGYGAAQMAVAVMTDQLEGATHDRSSDDDRRSDPIVDDDNF